MHKLYNLVHALGLRYVDVTPTQLYILYREANR